MVIKKAGLESDKRRKHEMHNKHGRYRGILSATESQQHEDLLC